MVWGRCRKFYTRAFHSKLGTISVNIHNAPEVIKLIQCCIYPLKCQVKMLKPLLIIPGEYIWHRICGKSQRDPAVLLNQDALTAGWKGIGGGFIGLLSWPIASHSVHWHRTSAIDYPKWVIDLSFSIPAGFIWANGPSSESLMPLSAFRVQQRRWGCFL